VREVGQAALLLSDPAGRGFKIAILETATGGIQVSVKQVSPTACPDGVFTPPRIGTPVSPISPIQQRDACKLMAKEISAFPRDVAYRLCALNYSAIECQRCF
jgi:hypothetical protein